MFTVVVCQAPAYDGAYGVEDVAAWEVVGVCDFGLAGGFFCLLALHDFGALFPQFQPCRRVNGIVDAAVAGDETAKQLGIGGIDDGVHLQSCDVPLPDGDSVCEFVTAVAGLPDRGDGIRLHDSAAAGLFL